MKKNVFFSDLYYYGDQTENLGKIKTMVQIHSAEDGILKVTELNKENNETFLVKTTPSLLPSISVTRDTPNLETHIDNNTGIVFFVEKELPSFWSNLCCCGSGDKPGRIMSGSASHGLPLLGYVQEDEPRLTNLYNAGLVRRDLNQDNKLYIKTSTEYEDPKKDYTVSLYPELISLLLVSKEEEIDLEQEEEKRPEEVTTQTDIIRLQLEEEKKEEEEEDIVYQGARSFLYNTKTLKISPELVDLVMPKLPKYDSIKVIKNAIDSALPELPALSQEVQLVEVLGGDTAINPDQV